MLLMKWAIVLLLLPREASSFVGFLFPPRTCSFSTATTCSSRPKPHTYYSYHLRVPLWMSSSSPEVDDVPEAQDGEALQTLFAKQCDKDGLMTKQMLKAVPAIQELLNDEDLLSQELDDIWEAAPKFPSLEEHERIDVDSFVQIYRDIDDMFEEDLPDEEERASNGLVENEDTTLQPQAKEEEHEEEEGELEITFQQICDTDELVSRQTLYKWEEIQKLLTTRLLEEEELNTIWEKTRKSPGSSDQLDVEGFLSFNVALDDLFDFNDDDEDEDEDLMAIRPQAPRAMVEEEDLPPGVLFAALANQDNLVGLDELQRWGELQGMLADELLLPLELQNIYDETPKRVDEKLDEAGFLLLYKSINALFEDDNQVETEELVVSQRSNTAKTQLLALIEDINSDTERLPCGLESTDREEKLVMEIVTDLEKSSSNRVEQLQGNVQLTDVAGSWELLFSTSSAMKFNKGLSGLGGSVPNGKFAGLVQNLQATKYMTDVEYIERIELNPSSASFNVRVTGDWDLRRSVSLFTGAPSTVMTVEPARVMYGPTTTKADHWKSLGPMNMLDVTYLDDDLRVMRGNTATDNIFIFKRIS